MTRLTLKMFGLTTSGEYKGPEKGAVEPERERAAFRCTRSVRLTIQLYVNRPFTPTLHKPITTDRSASLGSATPGSLIPALPVPGNRTFKGSGEGTTPTPSRGPSSACRR